MTYKIALQLASEYSKVPTRTQLQKWVKEALKDFIQQAELCIRIVDKSEIQQLNHTYRHKNQPTNVLSFPSQLPSGVELKIPYLGDLIICAEVVAEEAFEQQKSLNAHWAHMIIHGILHLLGHDHIIEEDAIVMEQIEINILQRLNIANPYEINT